jgi:RNA polymerase sigma-70 factor, ECF subfamily
MTLPSSFTPVSCEAEKDLFLLIPRKLRIDKNARDTAFSLLVDRYARLLYRIAFSLLRNAQDAEDAVQETFLKLYRREAWQQMNDEQAFLARSVWRVALDRIPRKKEQPLEQHDEQLASKCDSPETQAIQQAQTAHLRRLMNALPEELRQVLVLSAIEELNSREVGLMIGVPEGTVRTRLMRAREELRRRFEAGKGRKP